MTSGCQWLGRGKDRQEILRAVKLLYMILTTLRMNPSINYGLWVIMTCWFKFTSCNRCTPLVGFVDNAGGSREAVQAVWGKFLLLLLIFFCEHKIKVNLKK